MFQLLKYLLDNQPTREGAKEKRGIRKRPCKDVVHPQRIWCWFMTSCAPARSGISATASPVAPARSGISATSQQPGLAIPTRGLGTRGPSPASPEAGVQHLEHKAPSAGMVVCPCRAPRCSRLRSLLTLLGCHTMSAQSLGYRRKGTSKPRQVKQSHLLLGNPLCLCEPGVSRAAAPGRAHGSVSLGTGPSELRPRS